MRSKTPVVLLLFSTLGAPGCRTSGEQTGEEERAVPVAVHTVLREPVAQRYVASGSLRGRQTAVLTSKAPAYVQEVRFKAGDRVEAGQLLFVLEDSELSAKLRAARAALEEARQARIEAESGLKAAEAGARVATATHKRFQALREKRAVTRQELDEVDARYEAANAEKEAAEARLRRIQSSSDRAEAELDALGSLTRVGAPFTGRVIERRVDVGNLAAPGTPLAVLEQEGPLHAEVSVEESHAGNIQVGDPAKVWMESRTKPIDGRVSEIFPAIDVRTRAFLVKVDLLEDASATSSGELRPGNFVRVGFAVGQAERILIPESAVFNRGQLEMVYVVEEGRTRLRLVTLGRREDSRVEILSGLTAGENVVREPGDGIAEGMQVVAR